MNVYACLLLVLLAANGGMDRESMVRRPYCGLYALYGAAILHERQVDFSRLLSPAFVSSQSGSTADELLKAASHIGLQARLVKGLTKLDLQTWNSTAILHVKANSSSRSYDHWVLMTRCEGNDAVFLTASDWYERLPLSELQAVWDGIGIMIATTPIDDSFLIPQRLRYAALAVALALTLSVGLLWPSAGRYPIGRSIKRAVGGGGLMVALSFILAFAHHAWSSDGMPRNTKAIRDIQSLHVGAFASYIDSVSQLREEVQKPGTVVIDSRNPGDYKQGHFDRAINVPAHCSDATLNDATRLIGKNDRLVIYCQSERCPYSLRLASRLHQMGLENISIYRPGWSELAMELK
jgi:rhodanese-related sulfurtransferase